MPLYDIACSHCAGVFEQMLTVEALHRLTSCPYCKRRTRAAPTFGGAHAGTDADGGKQAPPARAGEPDRGARAARSRVPHHCKGHPCSICNA